MTKEIIDIEVKNELDELAEEEKIKIASEERVRKALWGLEMLEQEKLINSETLTAELMDVVRNRRRELNESKTYAKEALKSKSTDETDVKFHSIANQEVEKAEKIWSYVNAASIELDNLMLNGFADATAGRIKEKLKEKLQEMENSDFVEEKRTKKKDWERQL